MNDNKQPVVSIIVPVYNVSMYIEKCLQTLVWQSLSNIEIILVDDGSTDTSGQICDQYAGKYQNIKVIHCDNNGLGMARNRGLEIASGEYVGFVDSDDFISQRMYEILYRNAIENEADISYCAWKRFTVEEPTGESIIEDDENHLQLQMWSGKEDIRQYLLDRIGRPPECREDNFYGATVCGGIFRRQLLEEYSIHFESEKVFIAEDMLFDIDVILRCRKIVHCDAVLYFYRYNPVSLTTVYRSDRFEKNVILYHEMYNRLSKEFLTEDCFNSMSRYLLTAARIAIIQEAAFSKTNGRGYARKRIREICNCKEGQTILKKYPYKLLPWKYRYLCFLEKKRAAFLILFFTEFFYLKRKKYDT